MLLCLVAGWVFTPLPTQAGEGDRLATISDQAHQGDAAAQVELGGRYHQGQGVARNFKEALFWYTKAALQGNPAAQQHLGVMYAKGQGVAKNLIYSYAWSAVAAGQGQAAAARNRDNAARHLSTAELRQAEELTAKLGAKIGQPLPATAPDGGNRPPPPPPAARPQTPPPRGQAPKIKASGSGFIITPDGYLLTCHHVIVGGGGITVRVGQSHYPARVIRDDAKNDLALLKINGHFQPLAFAGERSATLGQEVFTIGFPDPMLQGVSAKFTKGEISSLAGIHDDARLYQISVPVQPGNSGGPLLDMNGNITGVIEAMLDAKTVFALTGSLPQSVNYAVKGGLARALVNGLPAVTANLPLPVVGQTFAQVVERVSQGAVMVVVHE